MGRAGYGVELSDMNILGRGGVGGDTRGFERDRNLANVQDSLYECRQGQQLQGRAYLGSHLDGYGGVN